MTKPFAIQAEGKRKCFVMPLNSKEHLNMPTAIEFHSAWYCPFAQRTWIALEYLGLPYDYKETDPYKKTDRWLEISRGLGQVPVLKVQTQDQAEIFIPDSLRTLEYLDELNTSDQQLFPVDPAQRAEARFWLDYQGRAIVPYVYRFLKAETGSKAAEEAKQKMMTGLRTLVQAMSDEGPFFFGAELSVVDIALAPFVSRIDILLSHFKDFHLPSFSQDGLEGDPLRFATWWQAMKTHPAFVATVLEPETYDARLLEFYLPYSQGGGQTDVTKAA